MGYDMRYRRKDEAEQAAVSAAADQFHAACRERDALPEHEKGRWAALRSEVESMRGDKYQLAGDHEESGHDWQTERCYGAVEALDWMLATIDRMTANPAPAGEE